VNNVDPTGRYNEPVHLLLTFEWGVQEGGSGSVGDALEIATSDQRMDEPLFAWPPNLHNPFFYPGYALNLGTREHFRNRSDVEQDLFHDIEVGDIHAFGHHLHSFQDTYSHAGYHWWSGGHVLASAILRAFGRTDPDDYSPSSARDQEMEKQTRYFLRMWFERKRTRAVAEAYRLAASGVGPWTMFK